MLHIVKNKFSILLLFFILLFPNLNLFGATVPPCDPSKDGYCLLEPLGSEGGQIVSIQSGTPQFTTYLQTIINIAIGVTGAISVIMLIIGGLQYILSSVSETAKKDAKDRITNSITAILIILSGYLILNTINPNLVNLSLPPIQKPTAPANTKKSDVPPPPAGGGGGGGQNADQPFFWE